MREERKTKLQRISELAGETAHAVTQNADGWKRFLDTANRIYNDICCKG